MKKFGDFLKEIAGTFAIVGCKDNPNFQVWGAKSDLKCKKNKKNKLLKMKFNDWVVQKEQNEKINIKDFFKRFKNGSAVKTQNQNTQKSINQNNGIKK